LPGSKGREGDRGGPFKKDEGRKAGGKGDQIWKIIVQGVACVISQKTPGGRGVCGGPKCVRKIGSHRIGVGKNLVWGNTKENEERGG